MTIDSEACYYACEATYCTVLAIATGDYGSAAHNLILAACYLRATL